MHILECLTGSVWKAANLSDFAVCSSSYLIEGLNAGFVCLPVRYHLVSWVKQPLMMAARFVTRTAGSTVTKVSKADPLPKMKRWHSWREEGVVPKEEVIPAEIQRTGGGGRTTPILAHPGGCSGIPPGLLVLQALPLFDTFYCTVWRGGRVLGPECCQPL